MLPFAAIVLIPALGASWVPNSEYWLYALKLVVVAALLVGLRPRLPEMKWSFGWPAVAVGIGMAVVWELLDRHVPGLNRIYQHARHLVAGSPLAPELPSTPWNPLAAFPDAPVLAYSFVALRVLGRSLLVPLVEEVFYRSFVYRYIISPKFETIPLNARQATAWLATSGLFAVVHPDQWLGGLICGLAYQWLVIRSGRLGDAMLAHGITNGLLSAWVIYQGTWNFS